MLKSWCFWNVVLEKTFENPLDFKEIQPVHPKRDQSWISIGSTNAEGEAPILWSPYARNWFIWKDPDAGKYWRQEEKGMTKDEMVGWYHWFNGHEFEQAPGVGDGQASLSMGSPRVKHDWATELNWTRGQKRSLVALLKAELYSTEKVAESAWGHSRVSSNALGSREQNKVET